MQFILTYIITVALGLGLVYGVAAWLGEWNPSLRIPTFVVIAAWWLWTATKYARLHGKPRPSAKPMPMARSNPQLGVPEGCDLELARREVGSAIETMRAEASSQGKEAYLANDVMAALVKFGENPNRANAEELIRVVPPFRAIFVGCAPGGYAHDAQRLMRP